MSGATDESSKLMMSTIFYLICVGQAVGVALYKF
jgi:hypothetical protein